MFIHGCYCCCCCHRWWFSVRRVHVSGRLNRLTICELLYFNASPHGFPSSADGTTIHLLNSPSQEIWESFCLFLYLHSPHMIIHHALGLYLFTSNRYLLYMLLPHYYCSSWTLNVFCLGDSNSLLTGLTTSSLCPLECRLHTSVRMLYVQT